MHMIGAGIGGKIAAMAGKCLHGKLKRMTGKRLCHFKIKIFPEIHLPDLKYQTNLTKL